VTSTVVLEIENLTVAYGGLIALDNVSFRVAEGEAIGLIGPNGAGKTTLLNCISGLARPSVGTIELRQRRIEGQRPHKVTAMGVGRTFQNAHFFKDFTALRYVMLGNFHRGKNGALAAAVGSRGVRRRERADRQAALEMLAAFDLADVAEVPLRELPYGVQRLVDVARAMVSAPSVLLLDEPTSGMMSGDRKRLIEVIGGLTNSQVTMIIIDHDMEFIRRCCKSVVAVSHGAILAAGRTEEVLESREVRSALLGLIDANGPS